MIGVFDSGFGGLHALRGIRKHLPQYSYLYLGDSARAPYGDRSADEIYRFTKAGVDLLFEKGAKLVVLACNTASSEALRKIQQEYGDSKKVIGVLIPFAEAAGAATKNKRVGVIATEGTVRSGSFPREITKVDPNIKVFSQACPELVPLVESGQQDDASTATLIYQYLSPLRELDIDTLVLGCTHYGILKDHVRHAIGPNVSIISEQDVLPQSLEAYLQRHPEIETRLAKDSSLRFFSTGELARFNSLGSIFFGDKVIAEEAHLNV